MSDTCKRCGGEYKETKTDLLVQAEGSHPEDPYDGSYEYMVFRHCPKCDVRKDNNERTNEERED